MLRVCLDAGMDITKPVDTPMVKNMSPLNLACAMDRYAAVEFLLMNGADPHVKTGYFLPAYFFCGTARPTPKDFVAVSIKKTESQGNYNTTLKAIGDLLDRAVPVEKDGLVAEAPWGPGAEWAVARRVAHPRAIARVLLLGDTPLRVLGFQTRKTSLQTT